MNRASTSIIGASLLSLAFAGEVQSEQNGSVGLSVGEQRKILLTLLGPNGKEEYPKLQERGKIITSKDIAQAGVLTFFREQSKFEQKGEIEKEGNTKERVTKIFGEIIESLSSHTEYGLAIREMDWELHIVSSIGFLDAKSFPLGKILVSKALVEKLDMTDDEIRLLLGHEITHILERHFIIYENQVATLSGGIVKVVEKIVQGEKLGEFEIGEVFSRQEKLKLLPKRFELEADREGFRLVLPLLDDINSAITFAQKLSSLDARDAHLRHGERVGQMQRLVTEEEEKKSTLVWVRNRVTSFFEEIKQKINTAYISVSVDIDTYRRKTKQKFASIFGE